MILFAGCAAKQEAAPQSEPEAEVVESEPEPEPAESESEPEEIAVEPEPECTTNTDCDDDNRCTTNSCKDGECVHNLEAGCVVSEGKNQIVEVNYSDENEYLKFEGNYPNIDGWQIRDDDGNAFEFKAYKQLIGTITIYTGNGMSTTTKLYWGKPGGILEEDDVIELVDEGGEVLDTWPH